MTTLTGTVDPIDLDLAVAGKPDTMMPRVYDPDQPRIFDVTATIDVEAFRPVASPQALAVPDDFEALKVDPRLLDLPVSVPHATLIPTFDPSPMSRTAPSLDNNMPRSSLPFDVALPFPACPSIVTLTALAVT